MTATTDSKMGDPRTLDKRAVEEDALKAMAELALNLAHEIRNPLNAAVLQLHLLGRNINKLSIEETEKITLRDRIRIVGDEIGRLSRLLTEFLELARPRDVMREPVHVASLVADVLDLEAESAVSKKIDILREIALDGCVALGDREKLKQVVLNLVVNAFEAMKDGGKLKVRVAGNSEYVTLEIQDNGAGIESDHLEQVFDPFFTTKEAGTGLGLSIVRKIVEQHLGSVSLDSKPGFGTKVTIQIPTGRNQLSRGLPSSFIQDAG